MKNTEKTKKISFSNIEKKLLNEIVDLAPEIQKVFYKLIKTGNGELYSTEFPRLNPILFLLSEFVKRPTDMHKKTDNQDESDNTTQKMSTIN